MPPYHKKQQRAPRWLAARGGAEGLQAALMGPASKQEGADAPFIRAAIAYRALSYYYQARYSRNGKISFSPQDQQTRSRPIYLRHACTSIFRKNISSLPFDDISL